MAMVAHGGSSVIVLLVSILIGALALHVASTLVLSSRDYEHALITAVLGGVAWALVDWVFAEAGLPGRLSSVVALIVWAFVIRWRYDVGWVRAAILGVVAWVAALVVLLLLDALGVGGLGAYGVPGA